MGSVKKVGFDASLLKYVAYRDFLWGGSVRYLSNGYLWFFLIIVLSTWCVIMVCAGDIMNGITILLILT